MNWLLATSGPVTGEKNDVSCFENDVSVSQSQPASQPASRKQVRCKVVRSINEVGRVTHCHYGRLLGGEVATQVTLC